jgi:hypothetical protein
MNTLKRIGFICIGMVLVSMLYATAINGWLDIPELTVSSNPVSGWGRLYFKTDGNLYKRNSAGTESLVGGGGGGTAAFNKFGERASTSIPSYSAGSVDTTLTNSQFTIPAGTVPAGGCLMADMSFKSTCGSNKLIKVWVGSTQVTLFDNLCTNVEFTANTLLCNRAGVTNAQQFVLKFSGVGNASWGIAGSQSSLAVDMATDQVFKITGASYQYSEPISLEYLSLRN